MALMVAAGGCKVNSALEQLSEARHLASSLLVRLTKAAHAGNLAVMADSDPASEAFAHEAEEEREAVQADANALKPILQKFGYEDETRLLDEFLSRFAEYRTLDRTILELAVQNTNSKARRLAFGPAQEAADAFRDALEAIHRPDTNSQSWHVAALAARALAALREIQVLQVPHIDEPGDVAMSGLETRMTAAETAARLALKGLAALVEPAYRPNLTRASADLDTFMGVHAQILGLSRRNTNVRSLALSLTQKGKLTAACEESLSALNRALAKRGFSGTR